MVNAYFLLIPSFFIGLAFGSFLNVVIYRHNTNLSFIRGRSICFMCNRNLSVMELIPLFSFMAQRGRCLECRSKISYQYPIVELTMGVIFVLFVNLFIGEGLSFINFFGLSFHLLFAALLLVISVYDFNHKIIPNEYSYSILALALIYKLILAYVIPQSMYLNLFKDLITGIVLFLFFAGVWFLTRGKAMGFGDAKLALGVGVMLGYPAAISAILYSFWTGAVVSIILLLFKYRSLTIKSEIPFGPFIAIGAILSFFIKVPIF